MVDVRVVRRDLRRGVGEIELDGARAAGLEVDEQRPARGVEHIAGVGFPVKHLLGAAPAYLLAEALQDLAQERAVGLGQAWGANRVVDEGERFGDPVSHRRDVQVCGAHRGMQAGEGARVLGRGERTVLVRCVVGPQGDLEAIAHVHLRGSARIEAADGCLCLRQAQHPIHLDLCPGVVSGSDAGDEIAGQHPHGEAIGVLEVDDLVGLEPEGSHHLHGGETGAGCRVRMHPADARAADARAQSFPRSRSRSRSRCWCGC